MSQAVTCFTIFFGAFWGADERIVLGPQVFDFLDALGPLDKSHFVIDAELVMVAESRARCAIN